ncbi:MAG TPA: hypothetical protein VN622_11870 [Clostridia bacterium]|nr:hypothetical protein [Clostridia bacterium]
MHPALRRTIVILLWSVLLVCAVAANAGSKKKSPPFSLKQVPDQTAQIRNIPSVTALQKCENWAWAAALEMSLLKQGVPLGQKFWVDKANGGALCLNSAGTLESLARVVEGEYVLEDGRKFRLEVRWQESAPGTSDRVLVPLALGRPYILYWRGHAYVPQAALWDEYIYPTGQKTMEIKELTLLDPYESGEKQFAKFTADKDDASELGGVFEVIATEIAGSSPWK